jgi:hypothetical protein
VVRLSIELLLETAPLWVELDEQRVREYVEAPGFAPVVVFETSEGLKLADGYHRVEAARRRGADSMEAEVRRGTYRDALRYAAAVNRRPPVEPGDDYLRELAASRENVRQFRASIGLPTDDAVIDWLMTQWRIGLTIFETDEEAARI